VTITGRSQTTLDQVLLDFQDLNTQKVGSISCIKCDHSVDNEVDNLFEQFENGLDVLINNAFSGVTALLTANPNFWENDPNHWDDVNHVGLRNHYRCSVFASRIMIKNNTKGFICTISSFGGVKRFNTGCSYYVGKEGKDRMMVEMAVELAPHGITAFSYWPGAVKTELISKIGETNEHVKKMFANGESTRFSGLCIAEILNKANDTDYLKKFVNGKVVQSGDMSKRHSIKDIDGREIISPITSQQGVAALGERFVNEGAVKL